MFKKLLIFFSLISLLFACSKNDQNVQIQKTEPTEEEIAINIYNEAVEALDSGNAYYAAQKFKEVESIMTVILFFSNTMSSACLLLSKLNLY